MKSRNFPHDLLWKNIRSLPYFRGFLRAVEGKYYEDIDINEPVLDLGCGDGHFSSVTLSDRPVCLIGVDPEWRSLNEARQYSVFSHLVCARGDYLPFAKSFFSTTMSNSVLEHIPDVDSVVTEIHRVMRVGSTLVVCVPNDNFTRNLSIARFFDHLGLKLAAAWYRTFFNKISRHFHPDPHAVWTNRLEKSGFKIERSWKYFTPISLGILELGHYFGLPSLINRHIFGRWILFPSPSNPILYLVYQWLSKHVAKDQVTPDGAYSFFISTTK